VQVAGYISRMPVPADNNVIVDLDAEPRAISIIRFFISMSARDGVGSRPIVSHI